MSLRFSDNNQTHWSFTADTLVCCPRCQHCAHSTAHRLSCTHCGYLQERSDNFASASQDARDPYFDLSLWLQTECCGEILWAYNLEHLKFIEALVRAKLRERTQNPIYGWANGSLASRLPRWMKLAKNRPAILRAVGLLHQRVTASTTTFLDS